MPQIGHRVAVRLHKRTQAGTITDTAPARKGTKPRFIITLDSGGWTTADQTSMALLA